MALHPRPALAGRPYRSIGCSAALPRADGPFCEWSVVGLGLRTGFCPMKQRVSVALFRLRVRRVARSIRSWPGINRAVCWGRRHVPNDDATQQGKVLADGVGNRSSLNGSELTLNPASVAPSRLRAGNPWFLVARHADADFRLQLFLSKGSQRVDFGSAACRNIAGSQRHNA